MVRRNSRAGVFGVEHRIHHELAHVLVLQAVEDGGPGPPGTHQPGHPQFGQMLGHRRRGLTDPLGQFVDRQLRLGERPQHLDPGVIGQHSEHLDHQTHLIVGQRRREPLVAFIRR